MWLQLYGERHRIIKQNNRKILQPKQTTTSACNCREKLNCPLDKACLQKSIVYMAQVTAQNRRNKKQYIGMTEYNFKGRYNMHKQMILLQVNFGKLCLSGN